MTAMGQHSAPSRPSGRPDKIAALAGAIGAFLEAPASALAKREVSAARQRCTDDEYEAAWAMVQRDEERAAWRPKLPALRNRAGGWQAAAVAVLITLIAGGLAAYAAAASYDTVWHLAAAKHVALPRLNPLGIEEGVIGMIVIDTVLTARGEPIWWLRWFIRAFSAGMVAANAAAGWPDSVGTGLRVAAPVLFIIITEAFRTWLLRRQRAAERAAKKAARLERRARRKAARDKRRSDRIPASRWLIDRRGTFAMWKRMRLWGEPSYENAVTMELARLDAIAKLDAKYPAGWQVLAPSNLVWMLEAGVRMPEALAMVEELTGPRRSALEVQLAEERAGREQDRAGYERSLSALRDEMTGELDRTRTALAEMRSDLEKMTAKANANARKPAGPKGRSAAGPEQAGSGPKTVSVPAAGTGPEDDEDDLDLEARALKLLATDLSMSGAELARKLEISEGYGRKLRRRLAGDRSSEDEQDRPQDRTGTAPGTGIEGA